MPRIGITIPAWKVAACHIQTDAVSCSEHITCGPEINLVLVGSPRFNQRSTLSQLSIAITSTDNTIGEILCIAIRVHIYQTCYKISIWRTSNGPEMNFDLPRHFKVFL